MNPEFQDQLKQQQKTEENRERRRLASGESTVKSTENEQDDEMTDDDAQTDFEDADLSDFMEMSTCTTPDVSERPKTRNSSRISAQAPLLSTVSASTQTEVFDLNEVVFPQSQQVSSKYRGKDGILINPKILECIVECKTPATCSLSTAITVTQIVAKRIFG